MSLTPLGGWGQLRKLAMHTFHMAMGGTSVEDPQQNHCSILLTVLVL